MNISQLIMPITFVLIEAIKRTELVQLRWLPILALIVGAAAGVGFAVVEPASALPHIINGMLYGASAAGIYDMQASATNVV